MEIVTKAEKREQKKNKAWNGARMGVRTNTLRMGQSLANFEAGRKTKKVKK